MAQARPGKRGNGVGSRRAHQRGSHGTSNASSGHTQRRQQEHVSCPPPFLILEIHKHNRAKRETTTLIMRMLMHAVRTSVKPRLTEGGSDGVESTGVATSCQKARRRASPRGAHR